MKGPMMTRSVRKKDRITDFMTIVSNPANGGWFSKSQHAEALDKLCTYFECRIEQLVEHLPIISA
jgi:hypothetical protein